MATYTQMVRLAEMRQLRLERQISGAETSIESWKGEIKSLDGVITALKGITGKAPAKVARARGKRGRKRGTWKPGSPGRPPQWFVDQQKAAGKPGKVKKARRKKRRIAKNATGTPAKSA